MWWSPTNLAPNDVLAPAAGRGNPTSLRGGRARRPSERAKRADRHSELALARSLVPGRYACISESCARALCVHLGVLCQGVGVLLRKDKASAIRAIMDPLAALAHWALRAPGDPLVVGLLGIPLARGLRAGASHGTWVLSAHRAGTMSCASTGRRAGESDELARRESPAAK